MHVRYSYLRQQFENADDLWAELRAFVETGDFTLGRPLQEFEEKFASCRTFVFMKELAALAKAGLIKGGDLDNAIVLVEREYSEEEIGEILEAIGRPELKSDIKVEGIGVLNTVQLKYENEPARHKLLDIIGDLALVGRPIQGHILAARPGHRSNVEFGKMVLEAIKKEEKERKAQ